MTLLSHRGVHQTFHRENLTNDTCTAARIFTPEHSYVENTLTAFQAAIDNGADWIEFDIHPTTDGEFAVFHDWELDCRTDGSGRVRDHSSIYLKALDIGHGYTSDNGATFPFRGKHIGSMPMLRDVLSEFPEIHFMINFKGRSKTQAEDLLKYLDDSDWKRLSVLGHINPVSIVQRAKPEVPAITKQQSKTCLKAYLLKGWSGYVPTSCYNMIIPVPLNYRHLAWGWPYKFEKRLNAVGSRSMLVGAYKDGSAGGTDSHKDWAKVPENYTGIVWTNKIEVIGPLMKSGQSSE